MTRNVKSEPRFPPASDERKPELCIGGFELWVWSRQFPDAHDYWDGNWLLVTARCSENFAVVQTGGSILHISEVSTFLTECKQIYASLSGEAHLDCREPYLDLKIIMKETGTCELFVSITPDHLRQEHNFEFDIDQSHLPSLIVGLESILRSYPLKGSRT